MNTFLRTCLVLELTAIALPAQSIQFALLQKQQSYVQSGPATVGAAASPWSFGARVMGSNLAGIAAPTFTTPAGSGTAGGVLSYFAEDGAWNYVAPFETQAALEAAFRPGFYAITLIGATVTVGMTGDLYPNAPQLTASAGTWNEGRLEVDSAQALTLRSNGFAGYSSYLEAHVNLSVSGPGYNRQQEAFRSTSPAQNSLTMVIPANSLSPGQTYTAEMTFDGVVDARQTLGLDATVYSSRTLVTIAVRAAATPPVFTVQPAAQTIASGGTTVFTAAANGTPTYAWRHNGVAIAGATGPMLVVRGALAADAGSYTCVATNALGTTPSSAATLTLSNTEDFGRLTNLSVLTSIASAAQFTVGTVIGGGGTQGSKPLLVRAVGPSLTPLGVSGVLSNPRLALLAGSTTLLSNDDWGAAGGAAALSAVFARVGAFPMTATTSRDAAVYSAATAPGNYSVQVSGVGAAAGNVIAELYDATAAGTFGRTTPRLVNVSVLKEIDTGGMLTVGFTVGGQTARTVLVRAVGPGLGVFGVEGAMIDPLLVLFNSASQPIAENDNWGGDPQIAAVANAVGAFVVGPASRDATILLTLPAGGYSAQVRGLNSLGGIALVEVYEVP